MKNLRRVLAILCLAGCSTLLQAEAIQNEDSSLVPKVATEIYTTTEGVLMGPFFCFTRIQTEEIFLQLDDAVPSEKYNLVVDNYTTVRLENATLRIEAQDLKDTARRYKNVAWAGAIVALSVVGGALLWANLSP